MGKKNGGRVHYEDVRAPRVYGLFIRFFSVDIS